jgi:hypothetical protein
MSSIRPGANHGSSHGLPVKFGTDSQETSKEHETDRAGPFHDICPSFFDAFVSGSLDGWLLELQEQVVPFQRLPWRRGLLHSLPIRYGNKGRDKAGKRIII